MPTPKKEQIVADLTDVLERSSLTILTDYRGLNVEALQTLRNELRPHNAEFRVTKNTLTRLAARANGLDAMEEILVGPTALVLAYADIAAAARVVRDFARESRILQIRGAVLDGELVSAERIEAIASLPSREVLLGRVVGGIAAPLSGLMHVLSGPQRSLLYALQARSQQVEQADAA